MGKYYNGKLKSIEETKSLHFSLHSNYFCLHVRVTDIVLYPSPQLHQSSIVLQNSTPRCSLDSLSCWAEDWWVHIVNMEISFHLSLKFYLFSVEFCFFFRTLLYQFSVVFLAELTTRLRSRTGVNRTLQRASAARRSALQSGWVGPIRSPRSTSRPAGTSPEKSKI